MEYVIFIGILLVLSIAMAMDLSWNNVITAERNTMVFADRNREYGAYVLRRDYVKRLLIAVVGSVLGLGMLPQALQRPDSTASRSPRKARNRARLCCGVACPSSARSSAVRAKPYSAITAGRSAAGHSSEATGKFS